MNLGEAIIDYRREVLKICTDQEDLKKDIDLLSGKLRKLFSNMNIDIKLFKEGGKKTGQWIFPESKKKVLFSVFTQLFDKDSVASMVSCGKYEDVKLSCLLELVDSCLDLLTELGSDDVKKIKNNVYKMLDIPLLSIRQELHEFERIMNLSFYNDDDCLPMELHMKYQKYFTQKLNELKIIAAMTYCGMNQEYQNILLRKEASRLKRSDGVDSYIKIQRYTTKLLNAEFPDLDISDSEMMCKYNERRKDLLEHVDNPFSEYVKYIVMQAEIEQLCAESEEYCNQVVNLNKVISKKTGLETKVHNYVEEKNKLDEIRNKLIKGKYGDSVCEFPDNLYVSDEDIEEDSEGKIENILMDNISIMEAMVKYDKQNLDDKIHFNLTEDLFGKLM